MKKVKIKNTLYNTNKAGKKMYPSVEDRCTLDNDTHKYVTMYYFRYNITRF